MCWQAKVRWPADTQQGFWSSCECDVRCTLTLGDGTRGVLYRGSCGGDGVLRQAAERSPIERAVQLPERPQRRCHRRPPGLDCRRVTLRLLEHTPTHMVVNIGTKAEQQRRRHRRPPRLDGRRAALRLLYRDVFVMVQDIG